MDTSVRTRGTAVLGGALGTTMGTALEAHVFHTHGHDVYEYTERVRELLYRADAVVTLCGSDSALAAALDTVALRLPADVRWYTDLVAAREAHAAKLAQFEKIDLLEGDASGAGPALNVCRVCQSSDVAWYQRQTRSADEGMVTFLQCRICGKRWKQ